MSMIKQYETKSIRRSEILLANYNPRIITSEAKRILKKNLEEKGLMGGVIWNETTNNLVSGHQRISILDKAYKYNADTKENDYYVNVTVVALTLEEEKEQNIFLNNTHAQGAFDEKKLEIVMKEINFTENSGFSKKEQINLFNSTEMLSEEEYKKISEQVSKLTDAFKDVSETSAQADSFYIVLVFKNATERNFITDAMDIVLDDDKFYNGNDFIAAVINSNTGQEM